MTVEVIHQAAAWREYLDACRSKGDRIGLVPTMGALHAGHMSLIRRAGGDCDLVAVTDYVNPLQFGAGEDLAGYPRDLDRDVRVAAEAGAHVVFAPSTEELWPRPGVTRETTTPAATTPPATTPPATTLTTPPATTLTTPPPTTPTTPPAPTASAGPGPRTAVAVAGLTDRMEGASRPGHFDGVTTIVAKLFNLAGPCWAYFGEKDYQQLAVIRRMANDLSFPVEVIGAPTVRDTDGLALSSRNAYLTPDERRAAPNLYYALLAGKRAIEDDAVSDPTTIEQVMADSLGRHPEFVLDYAEVADPDDLTRPRRIEQEVRLCIAARLGRARLIDNVAANPPTAE